MCFDILDMSKLLLYVYKRQIVNFMSIFLAIIYGSNNSVTCSAAIINVDDFIDDFISLWYESLHG